MLSIEEYNQRELIGKQYLSNRFIRAFKPQLFESGGFPTYVTNEQELIRYIDSMHAYSFDRHYNELCGGITTEEFDLLKKCTEDIYHITKEKYNGDFLVKAPMIAAICERRIICAALGTSTDKRIFEIGGGSGTLGSLLLEDGYKYSATDVTQAFYLIQNRLFEYINNNQINEMANQELDESSTCIHVPYWKLWEIRNNPFKMDLIISNHALLEMSPNSLKFYLNFCREALKESKDGVFVFQGGGWRINQNLIDLIELFDEYGYYLKYFDHHKEIAGFSLKEGSVKDEVIIDLKKLLQNVETEQIYALGTHITSRLNENKIYYCDELGQRMNDYFENIMLLPKVDISEIKQYYSTFGINENTPDDEFGNYILSRKNRR